VARTYITNELGDIHQVDEDGVVKPVDPSVWGWVNPGGKLDHAEMRRSIDALRALPGFQVDGTMSAAHSRGADSIGDMGEVGRRRGPTGRSAVP
jgi:hypothetical protein